MRSLRNRSGTLCTKIPKYHPRGVGGSFRSFLPGGPSTCRPSPTNGRWMVQILSTWRSVNVLAQSHQRQLVDGSDPFYLAVRQRVGPIPPTAVGGWFRSFLPCGPPTCRPNPTNGSWWMVQILSTLRPANVSAQSHQRQLVDGSDPFYLAVRQRVGPIPPTAVGGWFRSFLPCGPPTCRPNPTNGSWWMVQILSTLRPANVSVQSHQRQLVDGSNPFYLAVRQPVGPIPPTAVGGWFRSFLQIGPFSFLRRATRAALDGHSLTRKDLNNPPTAVGGISTFGAKPVRGRIWM